MLGVIKRVSDRLLVKLLEDETEELRLRCVSLELELKLNAGLEQRVVELESALSDAISVARGDGREPISPENQTKIRVAERILKSAR